MTIVRPINRTTPDPSTSPDQVLATAYGHADDHLQIVVSIGTRFLGESEAAYGCVFPKSSWSSRLEAFRRLVDEQRPSVVIFDPDALQMVVPEMEQWSDALLRRERSRFLDDLIEMARERSWTFLRPRPSSEVSRKLADRGFRNDPRTPPTSANLEDRFVLNELMPEVRDIAANMLESGTLQRGTLTRLIRHQPDEDAVATSIASMAYEALPPSQRRAARAMSVLRQPAVVNGALGPLAWSAWSEHGLTQEVIAALSSRSLARSHNTAGHTEVRLPRSLRTILENHLQMLQPETARELHGAVARGLRGSTPREQAERHHHAVQADDTELALRDSPYASDMRPLALRLSMTRDFSRAAEIYRAIVTRFDDEDAYAWEYLAWNLAQQHGSAATRGDLATEILAAYSKAHEIEDDNPLYHGRWLAFRVRCGEHVLDEFLKGLEGYLTAGRAFHDAPSWYAEPVLKALKTRLQQDDLRSIQQKVGWQLKRFPRLREFLA